MKRRIVTGERLTIARIYFKDGFRVPLHSHEQEQVTQVISGVLRFWLGANREKTLDLGPGDVIVIPSNVPHEALCIGDVEEMDTWSPRRDDWLNKTDDYLRQS
jgi:quercetin dioxygenase-like cupin family protein